jgi:hypothetical protein
MMVALVVEDDQAKGELWAFKATYEASSKQEVLQLVRAHPLGFNEPKEHDTYNGVQADVNTLVAGARLSACLSASLARALSLCVFLSLRERERAITSHLSFLLLHLFFFRLPCGIA